MSGRSRCDRRSPRRGSLEAGPPPCGRHRSTPTSGPFVGAARGRRAPAWPAPPTPGSAILPTGAAQRARRLGPVQAAARAGALKRLLCGRRRRDATLALTRQTAWGDRRARCQLADGRPYVCGRCLAGGGTRPVLVGTPTGHHGGCCCRGGGGVPPCTHRGDAALDKTSRGWGRLGAQAVADVAREELVAKSDAYPEGLAGALGDWCLSPRGGATAFVIVSEECCCW